MIAGSGTGLNTGMVPNSSTGSDQCHRKPTTSYREVIPLNKVLPPAEFAYGNLLITPKGGDGKGARRRCWAGYEMTATHYDFLPAEKALAYHDSLTRLLRELADVEELHMAMVPEPIRAAEVQEQMSARLQGDAVDYCRGVADALRAYGANTDLCRFRFFLWLRLPAQARFSVADLSRVRGLQDLRRIATALNVGAGISEEQLVAWTEAEQTMQARLSGLSTLSSYRFRPLTREEVLYRSRAPLWRSIGEPPFAKGWAPGATVQQGRGGAEITPDEGAMRRMYSGLVDHAEDWTYVKVTQLVGGEPVTAYQSFLTVEQFSPNPIPLPGGEWAYRLQQECGPVELHIRWAAKDYQSTLDELASQKRKQADTAEQEMEHAGGPSTDTYRSRDEADEMEQYVKDTRSPSLYASIVVGVVARTPEVLRQRVRHVHAVFDRIDIKLAHNGPDQAKHFYECLPGAPRLVEDYVHRLLPPALATCMMGTTNTLMDPAGTFIAVDDQGRPLWYDPTRALAKLDTSGSVVAVGPMGKGKSAGMNFLTWLCALYGAKVLAIDSAKPERSEWPKRLPYLGQRTKVVTLSTHEADRGKLDPYTIFSDRTEATNHAVSQAAFLTQTKLHEPSYDVLLRAFTEVRDRAEHPCMMAGIRALERLGQDREYKYRAEAERLAERLQNMSTLAYANLLFGDGQGARIDTSQQITVLQLDRIRRPPEGKELADFTLDELLGHAILVATVAFAASFAAQDRRQQKIILADEIRWFVNNAYGRDLIEQQTLTGRAMGTQVFLVGQNVSHIPQDLHQHFTMRLAFGADSEREAEATLEFLGAPPTPENIDRLMRLNPGDVKGQCLIRDLEGRIGEAQICMVYEDLVQAFRTTSLTEGELADVG